MLNETLQVAQEAFEDAFDPMTQEELEDNFFNTTIPATAIGIYLAYLNNLVQEKFPRHTFNVGIHDQDLITEPGRTRVEDFTVKTLNGDVVVDTELPIIQQACRDALVPLSRVLKMKLAVNSNGVNVLGTRRIDVCQVYANVFRHRYSI